MINYQLQFVHTLTMIYMCFSFCLHVFLNNFSLIRFKNNNLPHKTNNKLYLGFFTCNIVWDGNAWISFFLIMLVFFFSLFAIYGAIINRLVVSREFLQKILTVLTLFYLISTNALILRQSPDISVIFIIMRYSILVFHQIIK